MATRPIPRGTVTWAMCDLEHVFAPEALVGLSEPYRTYLGTYTFTTDLGDHVLCCDVGRYLNHSCTPNTLSAPGRLFDIAVRDIEPGAEVTGDYGTLNLSQGLNCLCATDRCRGTVRVGDRKRLEHGWGRQLRAATELAGKVHQPLLLFLGPDARAAAGLAAATSRTA